MIEIKIFELITSNPNISYQKIKDSFPDITESTLIRNINKLIKKDKISKIKKGKNTFYIISWKFDIENYFDQEFFIRKPATYNFDFLDSYIPNKSSFLGSSYEKIKESVKNTNTLQTIDYKNNIRWIENMLIDLSYTSSKLEWNTYSYLDTEVLIKYNESAKWKSQFETQMVLDHKSAIQYIIDNRKEIKYNKKVFFDIHSILWKWLMNVDYLGKIRTNPVEIWWSTYKPIDNQSQLIGEFEKFLKKINEIKNPFEQSLFILVFIPYFQLFMDINKRVSRISSNIPLIKSWYPPISLLQIKEKTYITAILAVYELNDTSLIAKIYTENYIQNMHRYVNQSV